MRSFRQVNRDKTPLRQLRARLHASFVLITVLPLAGAHQTVTARRLELPVVFRQKVIAGVTTAGTPIAARLKIATLIDGTVVPAGATLSGHVELSEKNEADRPSRVRIKFDSVRWKTTIVPIRVYATGAYYPYYPMERDDVRDITNAPVGPDVSDVVGMRLSTHWVRPDDADAVVEDDGSITVVSSKHPLKFNKDTTYLLTNPPAKH